MGFVLSVPLNQTTKTASFFPFPRFSSATEEELTGHSGGGSGGYLEHIYKYAAKELFGIEVDTIQYKPLKYEV